MARQSQLSHLLPGSQEAVPLGTKNYATSMQECSNPTQCSAANQEIVVGSLHRTLRNLTELHEYPPTLELSLSLRSPLPEIKLAAALVHYQPS